MERIGVVGLVGRFKPLHNQSALFLEGVCKRADQVFIAIGSSNRYNLSNPFSAEESAGMIDAFLSPRFKNYSIFFIPDFGNVSDAEGNNMWAERMKFEFEQRGGLDYFVTGNPYVAKLLQPAYQILKPKDVMDRKMDLRGTLVRLEMARGDAWKTMVPNEAVSYLENNNLIARFRKEFGAETIAKYEKQEREALTKVSLDNEELKVSEPVA